MYKQKIYKVVNNSNISMTPSDPTGSLDESFFISLINYLNTKVEGIWKRQ